uniref:Uncharacterized protein n=1 Tax=Mycena chlorophos TaxID=658473 RepID=A0ABQ0L097_MYCCL|nr:predicted protein [Mycena chlorophos]
MTMYPTQGRSSPRALPSPRSKDAAVNWVRCTTAPPDLLLIPIRCSSRVGMISGLDATSASEMLSEGKSASHSRVHLGAWSYKPAGLNAQGRAAAPRPEMAFFVSLFPPRGVNDLILKLTGMTPAIRVDERSRAACGRVSPISPSSVALARYSYLARRSQQTASSTTTRGLQHIDRGKQTHALACDLFFSSHAASTDGRREAVPTPLPASPVLLYMFVGRNPQAEELNASDASSGSLPIWEDILFSAEPVNLRTSLAWTRALRRCIPIRY